MRSNDRRPVIWLLAVLCCAAPAAVRSQQDVADTGDAGAPIHSTIIEGPDPIPPVRFWPVLEPESGTPLNEQGTERGDGRPHIARDPRTGYSLVIWSYNLGGDRDIAFSEWDGERWLPIRFLTATTTDDLDPMLAIAPEGTVYAAWWESAATDQVVAARRAAGATAWSPAEMLSTAARRPAIALSGKALVVACERDEADGARAVVAITPGPSTAVGIEVLDRPSWDGPFGLAFFERDGRLLLRWRRTERFHGWSEYVDGTWVPLSHDGSAPPKL